MGFFVALSSGGGAWSRLSQSLRQKKLSDFPLGTRNETKRITVLTFPKTKLPLRECSLSTCFFFSIWMHSEAGRAKKRLACVRWLSGRLQKYWGPEDSSLGFMQSDDTLAQRVPAHGGGNGEHIRQQVTVLCNQLPSWDYSRGWSNSSTSGNSQSRNVT